MNKALQQVGGSYLLCQLSRDGTAVTVTPQGGLTRQQALDRLAELDALAEQIYGETVTPEMGQREQAEALYTYLTEHVRYDFRYYGEPGEMPYDSTTAYGALHDNLAICGGYAQAFQLLLEQAGIPCVTVSGTAGGGKPHVGPGPDRRTVALLRPHQRPGPGRLRLPMLRRGGREPGGPHLGSGLGRRSGRGPVPHPGTG